MISGGIWGGIPILGTSNLGAKLGKPGEIMGLKRDSKLYFDVKTWTYIEFELELELIFKRHSLFKKF